MEVGREMGLVVEEAVERMMDEEEVDEEAAVVVSGDDVVVFTCFAISTAVGVATVLDSKLVVAVVEEGAATAMTKLDTDPVTTTTEDELFPTEIDPFEPVDPTDPVDIFFIVNVAGAAEVRVESVDALETEGYPRDSHVEEGKTQGDPEPTPQNKQTVPKAQSISTHPT